MSVVAINLVLAFIWAALTGNITLTNLCIGYALGFVTLFLARPLFQDSDRYFLRVPRFVRLSWLFVYDLVVSSLRVAVDVLRPVPTNRPGIVAVPLKCTTDAELLLLSSLVTLTPGSLSLDLSEDQSCLFVHGMFVDDPDAFRKEISEDLEPLVLEAMR